MTTTTRTCAGCGYKFAAAPGDVYCSSVCAGSPTVATLLAEARRLAAWQALASRSTG